MVGTITVVEADAEISGLASGAGESGAAMLGAGQASAGSDPDSGGLPTPVLIGFGIGGGLLAATLLAFGVAAVTRRSGRQVRPA
jgi:hypothetical protein